MVVALYLIIIIIVIICKQIVTWKIWGSESGSTEDSRIWDVTSCRLVIHEVWKDLSAVTWPTDEGTLNMSKAWYNLPNETYL
jgi:hypothetical protein